MSRKGRYLFTSESVTEGHPDKIADQISDSVLDAILAQDPVGRVACESLLTTGLVVVAGEITTSCYVDIPRIARETIREVGYTRAKFGFDYETCGVITAIDEQSSDIAMGVAEPVSVMVDTFGTGKLTNTQLEALVRRHFDFTPAGIIKYLNLRRPIYKKTAAYGHFGRSEPEFTWER